MGKNKGSLTVEATFVLTTFILLFLMLLNFVKIAIIEYELQVAVTDTANDIASNAYLLGKVNAWQDDEDEELLVTGYGAIDNFSSLYSGACSGVNALFADGLANRNDRVSTAKADAKLESASLSMILTLAKNFVEVGVDGLYRAFYDQLGQHKQDMFVIIAKSEVHDSLSNAIFKLDESKLSFDIVKFPQTEREYNASAFSIGNMKAGILRDVDFEKDDVVISISYKYPLAIPFSGSKDIILRKTAVQKAWLLGGDGVFFMPHSDKGVLSLGFDKLFEALDNTPVYVTSGSPEYHKDYGCRKLENAAAAPISKMSAEELGYKACEVCQFRSGNTVPYGGNTGGGS